MYLQSIRIERLTYGEDKGKLLGTLTVDNQDAAISLKISDERAQQIIVLIAAELINQAKETAELITANIIEGAPQIGTDA